MEKNRQEKSTKITKYSLVIYCLIIICLLISFLVSSLTLKNYTYIYGFLLCLGPSILFVLISVFLPTSKFFDAKSGKGVIAIYVILYVVKYAAIIGMPFVGLTFEQFFNK
ncbi:MAG: hypothetical protein MJ223_01855 [Mycoplasmoidaceae bacterium]|nr:hypothetical protein [Mycoplasmoidaceae bacterium]